MCISDDKGDTRDELHWGDNPAVFFHIDRGPIGFPARIAYFNRNVGQLRGGIQPDTCHTRQRANLNAYHESGLTLQKVEFAVVMKCLRGAFGSFANWNQVLGLLHQWSRTASIKDHLFQYCHSILTHCREGGRYPPDYGSETHMDAMIRAFVTSKLWKSPGDQFKVGRWFNTPKKILKFIPYMGV